MKSIKFSSHHKKFFHNRFDHFFWNGMVECAVASLLI